MNCIDGAPGDVRYFGATQRYDFIPAGSADPLLCEGRVPATRRIAIDPRHLLVLPAAPDAMTPFIQRRSPMPAGHPLVKTLRAGVLALCAFAALAAASAHAAPLYPGEDALYAKAADEGRRVVRHGRMGELEGAVRRVPQALSEGRDHLQRHRLGRDRGVARQVAPPSAADTAYYFAASALDAESKDVVAPFRSTSTSCRTCFARRTAAGSRCTR